jgi:hypothetical protein
MHLGGAIERMTRQRWTDDWMGIVSSGFNCADGLGLRVLEIVKMKQLDKPLIISLLLSSKCDFVILPAAHICPSNILSPPDFSACLRGTLEQDTLNATISRTITAAMANDAPFHTFSSQRQYSLVENLTWLVACIIRKQRQGWCAGAGSWPGVRA